MRIFYFIFLLSVTLIGNAQSINDVNLKKKNALTLFNEKKYKESIKIWEEIIAINPKRFAGCNFMIQRSYFALNDYTKAEKYMESAIKSGFFFEYEIDSKDILNAPFDSSELSFLKKTLDKSGRTWFSEYKNSFKMDLVLEIEKLLYADQIIREIYSTNKSTEVLKVMSAVDSINSAQFFGMIKTKGIPKLSNVGDIALHNVSVILMHILADGRNDDIENNFVSYELKKLIHIDEFNPDSYASVFDNIYYKTHNRQIFGTINQVQNGICQYWTFKDVDSVNTWREEIGLEKIDLKNCKIENYH